MTDKSHGATTYWIPCNLTNLLPLLGFEYQKKKDSLHNFLQKHMGKLVHKKQKFEKIFFHQTWSIWSAKVSTFITHLFQCF